MRKSIRNFVPFLIIQIILFVITGFTMDINKDIATFCAVIVIFLVPINIILFIIMVIKILINGNGKNINKVKNNNKDKMPKEKIKKVEKKKNNKDILNFDVNELTSELLYTV